MTVVSTMSYLQSNIEIEGYFPLMNRCRVTKEPFPAPCRSQLFLAVSGYCCLISFVFRLLHGNAIKRIDGNAFRGLTSLQRL